MTHATTHAGAHARTRTLSQTSPQDTLAQHDATRATGSLVIRTQHDIKQYVQVIAHRKHYKYSKKYSIHAHVTF